LADVQEAKERLKKRQEERKEPVLKELRERLVKEAAGRLTKLKERLSELERQQTDLTQEAQRTRQEVEKLAPQSAELEQKRAEIEQAEELTRRLRSKKEWLSFELLTYKKRVILVARAEASAARPAASAVAASAALGAAGFALGALGVGFIESRRRRLVHSTDAAQAMKLRVFGHLPLVPGLARGPLLGVWGTQFGLSGSLLVEAVNDFRAMLLSGGSGRPPQVIMATSAGEGEGKTTLACLLALSLAQIGKRTLLIDGDLRNPQVSNRLVLPASAGLGEVLRGEARPGGVIGGVPGTPLAVMSAGRPCATIIRGLSVERVQQVLAELRKQFDHIVIDSSPAPLTDGLVIGACVDAAVLVVRAGHSAEPLVRTACERLLAGRVPLVGGVMNGLPSAGHGLRYPYASLPPAEPADAPSVATSA
jgi:capsular exopolysaccharide synthesis family protein